MTKRGSTGRFRCDECRRVLDLADQGGDDCGASRWFCYRCLEAIENRFAIIEARIDRRHPHVRVSNHNLWRLVDA